MLIKCDIAVNFLLLMHVVTYPSEWRNWNVHDTLFQIYERLNNTFLSAVSCVFTCKFQKGCAVCEVEDFITALRVVEHYTLSQSAYHEISFGLLISVYQVRLSAFEKEVDAVRKEIVDCACFCKDVN